MNVDEGYLIPVVAKQHCSNFTEMWIKVNFITSLHSSHQENHPFTHCLLSRRIGGICQMCPCHIFLQFQWKIRDVVAK